LQQNFEDKMAIVEDVISIVIIIVIILVAGIFLMNNYMRITQDKEEFWLQYDLEDKYSSSFNSLLEVSEPNSRRSFGDLLGSAAYYRNDIIDTPSGEVQISQEFKKLLDTLFPDQNYFFEVSAPFESLELIFMVDGSESMKDESKYLAENMNFILKEVNESYEFKNMNVSASVYILDMPNSTGCKDYSSASCGYLTYTDIYFNEDYTAFDLKKYKNKLFKPSNFYDEEEVWRSDWETALSAFSLMTGNKKNNTMKIVFPMTDSLPGATQYFYTCPIDYANSILDRDVEILRKSNFIIDPIFSTNNDPILYCDEDVISQMESLTKYTNGQIILNRDNFATRIKTTIIKNSDGAGIMLGNERQGTGYSIQRRLPMPNGKLAEARLHIYTS
jgi:hypothetical protein